MAKKKKNARPKPVIVPESNLSDNLNAWPNDVPIRSSVDARERLAIADGISTNLQQISEEVRRLLREALEAAKTFQVDALSDPKLMQAILRKTRPPTQWGDAWVIDLIYSGEFYDFNRQTQSLTRVGAFVNLPHADVQQVIDQASNAIDAVLSQSAVQLLPRMPEVLGELAAASASFLALRTGIAGRLDQFERQHFTQENKKDNPSSNVETHGARTVKITNLGKAHFDRPTLPLGPEFEPIRKWLSGRYLHDAEAKSYPGLGKESLTFERLSELTELLDRIGADTLPTLETCREAGWIEDFKLDVRRGPDVVTSKKAERYLPTIIRLNLPEGSHRLVGIRKGVLDLSGSFKHADTELKPPRTKQKAETLQGRAKPKRGRPADTDKKLQERIVAAWKSEAYTRYEELGRELHLPTIVVKRAIDLARKPPRKAKS